MFLHAFRLFWSFMSEARSYPISCLSRFTTQCICFRFQLLFQSLHSPWSDQFEPEPCAFWLFCSHCGICVHRMGHFDFRHCCLLVVLLDSPLLLSRDLVCILNLFGFRWFSLWIPDQIACFLLQYGHYFLLGLDFRYFWPEKWLDGFRFALFRIGWAEQQRPSRACWHWTPIG